MRIIIAAIGKARQGPEQALYEHYAARLPWPLTLKECEEKRQLPTAALKQREAELLLAASAGAEKRIALDEKGKAMSSEAFAAMLGKWRDEGAGSLAFFIGGHHGLDDSVRRNADLTLSLSPLTWPHLLVRPLLAEQLYRVYTILTNHPYHRA